LFGRVYAALQSDFFWDMPAHSGVLVTVGVPTARIVAGANRPGDIDLLIVPYVGAELVLDRILAVEVKIVRASFVRQGHSPNDFGFSQAAGLKQLGFPHVAVVHLIVSDSSPPSHWELVGVFRILDHDGRAQREPDRYVDTLPSKLMDRCFGRLLANCPDESIGLGAAYIEPWTMADRQIAGSDGYWLPSCRSSTPNSLASVTLVEAVANYYERYPSTFLATPRHDPLSTPP